MRYNNNNNKDNNMSNNLSNNHYNVKHDKYDKSDLIIDNPNALRLNINEYTNMGVTRLQEEVKHMGINIENINAMKKQDLIFAILKDHTDKKGIIYASGVLEILSDGYGFLRSSNYNYLSGPDDIYISPSQIS